MKKSVMSVKEMVALYVNCHAAEETWDMLYKMASHGLISRANWIDFFNACKGWVCEDDGIHDGENLIYFFDENGFLRKAV